MTRTFHCEFVPADADPASGPMVELTVQEIEDAGLREVLQTPGAPISSWSFLGDLLQPGDPFVFHEPLGQAREVKVALSGLLGRFVARAYLQRYCNLSVFHQLGPEPIHLNAARRISITANEEVDWSDWVACTKGLSRNNRGDLRSWQEGMVPLAMELRAPDVEGIYLSIVDRHALGILVFVDVAMDFKTCAGCGHAGFLSLRISGYPDAGTFLRRSGSMTRLPRCAKIERLKYGSR